MGWDAGRNIPVPDAACRYGYLRWAGSVMRCHSSGMMITSVLGGRRISFLCFCRDTQTMGIISGYPRGDIISFFKAYHIWCRLNQPGPVYDVASYSGSHPHHFASLVYGTSNLTDESPSGGFFNV